MVEYLCMVTLALGCGLLEELCCTKL